MVCRNRSGSVREGDRAASLLMVKLLFSRVEIVSAEQLVSGAVALGLVSLTRVLPLCWVCRVLLLWHSRRISVINF